MAHPNVRKKVEVFALSIYGLIVFQNILGHIDEAITDLFDRLDKRVTPVLVILTETFRSLNACRRAGEVFSESYSPLEEVVATSRRDDISEEKWMAIFQNLQKKDIEWRAPWLLSDKILYQCGDFDWVPLLGIWGAIGYAPLLVLRQYRLRQFTRQMRRLAIGPMITSEYGEWWVGRINDNIPGPSLENSQSIDEHLRVVPSELEIVKQDFERRNVELEKKIEQIEEEKVNLRLDVDVQKLEADKPRKGKNKAE
ncbi:hypothetical protein Goklo_029349, partial [Gossypium klotzschianum]|nr:hypothetical protein [Gossypium klotzschianum]